MSQTSSPSSDASRDAADTRWTTSDLLTWMRSHFHERGVDSPRVVAEMLLAHVIGCERLRLYMEPQRPATPDELKQLRELVVRASNREPVQYLTGLASFFGRDFFINQSTQIPQPCTEVIVERVLAWRRKRLGLVEDDVEDQSAFSVSVFAAGSEDEWPAAAEQGETGDASAGVHVDFDRAPRQAGDENTPVRVLDIGTGSGCLAVTLALQIPEASVVATDVADDVLELARRNAERFGVADRIEFRAGSLWEPISARDDDELFDVMVSNPPYVPDAQWESEMDPSVKQHTSPSALRGGTDGLDVIRPLIADAPRYLKPGGLLAVEIAHVQRDAVIEMAQKTNAFEHIDVHKDEDDLWRVLTAEKI